jgi:phosphoglycerate dehydrogenase-like enzyme
MSAATRPETVLAMQPGLPRRLFSAAAMERLRSVAAVDTRLVLSDLRSPAARAQLERAQIILSGWGCPPIDEHVLEAAPALRAIVHAAGGVKGHVTPACWERGIRVSTAAAANAVPVAEYALSRILLANKAADRMARTYRERRTRIDLLAEFPEVGNRGKTVGIVGASRIGRRLIALLRPFELDVIASDPYLDDDTAARLGVARRELDDLLAASDVVSLHAPALPSTRHMLDARRLALLRDGATLINTARGSLVDQDALVAELTSGRIDAVIDVTEPEVLPSDSPLYDLPNVVLTPHIAGALGVELQRLGDTAIEEIERYAAGEPFAHAVTAGDLERLA